MSNFFRPYEGRKPFAFVSYSHCDSDTVIESIFHLHEQKYRVWYDEGIPAGSDWPRNIALHLRACSAVLFFISASSLVSNNCFNEIKEAVHQNKPILCLRLDATPLPPEWDALIGRAPTLHAENEPSGAVAAAILAEGTVTSAFLGDGTNDPTLIGPGGRFNLWTIAAGLGVLLLVATMVGTYGLTNHWFDECLASLQDSNDEEKIIAVSPSPTPTALPTLDPQDLIVGIIAEEAEFPDAQQERSIRDTLDQPDGDVLMRDVLTITQLHICGGMTLKNSDGIAFDRYGNCSVNSAPVMRGEISSMELIGEMLPLERLSLVYQQIEKIDLLSPLAWLNELNIAGNPIASIGDISGMVSLQTLHLEHTNIHDLTALNALSQLKTVTVSADMYPLTMKKESQQYDVILVP